MEQMLKAGYVPRLISLLKTPAFRGKTLKLLYHLSYDDRCKGMFTYTDGIPNLMGMVINFPQDMLAKELAALMINLGLHPRNNEFFIANKGLNFLMDRAADKRDPLLMKIIRNISKWTFNEQQQLETPELQYKYRGLWSPHIKVLLEFLQDVEDHDLLIQVMGCLANMTIYDLPSTSNWAKLMKDYNLQNVFSRMLKPGMSKDDFILEVIMLIANIASDDKACDLIAASPLIETLYQLWKEKASNDTEILLQLLQCFHKFFLHRSTHEEAMYSTRIVVDIIECLHHKHPVVREKADEITELIFELDRLPSGAPGNLGSEIVKKRFESYNRVWIENSDVINTYEDPYNSNHRPFSNHASSMMSDSEYDESMSSEFTQNYSHK